MLLTHPYGWPHVRRGAEREVHELAGRLVTAGHDARVLTGTPDGVTQRSTVLDAPVRYVRTPRRRGWPEPGPGFAGIAFAEALRTRPDVVHCLHYADAAGAARSGRPVVLKLTGTVTPERVDGLDARLLQSALERSAEVWCNSDYALAQMSGFGVPMRVVPAGVDTGRFRPSPRTSRPTVLVAAAVDEPRKRVADVLAAWPAVRAALPDAELLLAGTAEAPPVDGVRALGRLDDTELARRFVEAWAVVAPAEHEALGLVTVEALAAGTPVVGARSGATTELLRDVGILYAPGDLDELAAGVLAAVERAHDPAVSASSRAAAAPYDWERVLPVILEGYARVTTSAGPRRPAPRR